MQQRVRRALREIAAAELGIRLPDAKPQPPRDFGFMGGDAQALEDWIAWKKSNYTMGAVGGGWREQPDDWRHDVLAMEAVYVEEYNRLARQKPR